MIESKSAERRNRDPKNPYKPGTIKAALYEEDFSDLTIPQIAEVFGTNERTVYHTIYRIKKETGKIVQCRRYAYESEDHDGKNK